MENTSYGDHYRQLQRPDINALASKYGLATDYFGVTHPSEPNYVANIGGSFFGIQDDNQFYCTPALASTDPNCAGTTVDHTVNRRPSRLSSPAAGMTWKGYFQSLPPIPSSGRGCHRAERQWAVHLQVPEQRRGAVCVQAQPVPELHRNPGRSPTWSRTHSSVPTWPTTHLPNFSLVVPDQCHDMHGTGACSDENALISAGDTYVGNTVAAITASKSWQQGRNAIVVTWDEDDFSDQGHLGPAAAAPTPEVATS